MLAYPRQYKWVDQITQQRESADEDAQGADPVPVSFRPIPPENCVAETHAAHGTNKPTEPAVATMRLAEAAIVVDDLTIKGRG